ncbi:B12-binding domain-containing radical SAM protein [Desulforhopalus sp. IMCC35007]|uniref:B12-binding domain-containing radical SAM protein n=1 Tax=Desulforhopalus sp. IMCC35007 TaxID=2569543 RepID=UPI0010AE3CBD|nr:DUF4080 domain-containing protein [Desulforhopalus sp. IMCC35007]TKB10667.1 DUF4080 domain-containing protein [Desulforhopalus sp. IMCC35007]
MSQAKNMINTAKLVGLNGRYTHSCLALFYLRNELEKHCPNWTSEILQFTINDNYFELLLRITAGNPTCVFFSAAIWNSELVEKLTRDMAVCLPGCKVVIGGPQAFVLHGLLDEVNHSAVFGAIEAIDQQFYRDLENGTLQPCYKADFFKMPSRSYDYPYRHTDFDLHLANRHIYYESSRGCIFGCTYCLSSVERGVYHKPLDVVKEELRDILSHSPKVVRFIDRTFNDIPKRALSLWEFLLEEGGETLFHFEMAPDRFTEEMYTFLERVGSGRFQFEIGIQSTHKETLKAVNRPVETEVVHTAIQRLAGLGTIHLHVDLILGLPYETKDSFATSFSEVFFMGADYIQMGLLKILPETPLCYNAQEYGYKHSLVPPYSVLASRWMDHETVQDLYWFSECVEKYMNNRYFVLVWGYFRRHEENIFTFFQSLLALCQKNLFFSHAPTHELMCKNLITMFQGRHDSEVLMDLLRVDWLRCNNRFLPQWLLPGENEEQPQETKDRLIAILPEEVEGLFSRKTRNGFFRKTFFLRIQKKHLTEMNLFAGADGEVLCFLTERERNLHSYAKVLVL